MSAPDSGHAALTLQDIADNDGRQAASLATFSGASADFFFLFSFWGAEVVELMSFSKKNKRQILVLSL